MNRESGRGGVVRCDEEKRSVRMKSDRAEGEKEYGGQKNGIVNPDFQKMKFEPVFLPKANDSTGLQIAELVARSLALQ